MVTRKPVPQSNPNLAPTNSPPYPTTPITSAPSPHYEKYEQSSHTPQSEAEVPNPWTGEDLDKLSLHGSTNSSVPDALRPGPPQGYTPKTSQEKLGQNGITNPFIQRQLTGSVNGGKDSSAGAWGNADRPTHDWDGMDIPAPTSAPPPPPVPLEATPPPNQAPNHFSPDPNANPWGATLDGQLASKPLPISSISQEDSASDAWATPPPSRHAPNVPPVDTNQAVLVDLEQPESPAWDEDEPPSPVVHEMPLNNTQEVRQINEDRHAWDEDEGHPLHQNPPQLPPPTITTQLPSPEQQPDGWNLIDHDSISDGPQQSGVVSGSGAILETFDQEHPPALPPRRSVDDAPPQPPRPIVDTSMNQSSSSLMSPGSTARRQKKETYEIKKITWHDVNASQNPRISPILVQNANGPCPLLALVNALTLSTPADMQTALVETLRTREQVSLGLLLDAVFDELMSGRRGDAATELPDVSDLYSFLITLHTGMNVNPRFFPNPPTTSNDPRNSMSHVHPAAREAGLPGAFEETREMKLYSTFSIPLIHGWIPEKDSAEYIALNRSAKSYEDAQNLQFYEEELEDKLQREGLSFEEQATLEDITTIKAFFASNATQLTPHGLRTITASISPGAVAILFRNDHFSTLYRHPDTLQLLQLVTDMGYAGHEEVVWESLVDVNGEHAEFFSGDFRLVGGAPATPSTHQTPPGGWVSSSSRRASSSNSQPLHIRQSSNNLGTPPRRMSQEPLSPNHEQEDHDLALALQLQEEEEERDRSERARRQRETELSQQYIEQQGRNTNVPVNQRGGGRRVSSANSRGRGSSSSGPPAEIRPMIPPRRSGAVAQPVDPEAGVDAPPPTYEQAATQAAYVPPEYHPSHPNANPNAAAAHQRRTSAYNANSSAYQQAQAIGMERGQRRGTGPPMDQMPQNGRRNTGNGVASQQERDKDCVIM